MSSSAARRRTERALVVRFFRKRRFKGNRVEPAATMGIERFEVVAEEFMLNAFGCEAGCG